MQLVLCVRDSHSMDTRAADSIQIGARASNRSSSDCRILKSYMFNQTTLAFTGYHGEVRVHMD